MVCSSLLYELWGFLGKIHARQLFELRPEGAADSGSMRTSPKGFEGHDGLSAAPVTRTAVRPITSGISIFPKKDENNEKLARVQYTRDTLCHVPVRDSFCGLVIIHIQRGRILQPPFSTSPICTALLNQRLHPRRILLKPAERFIQRMGDFKKQAVEHFCDVAVQPLAKLLAGIIELFGKVAQDTPVLFHSSINTTTNAPTPASIWPMI